MTTPKQPPASSEFLSTILVGFRKNLNDFSPCQSKSLCYGLHLFLDHLGCLNQSNEDLNQVVDVESHGSGHGDREEWENVD